jgi:hypothetical protein
MTSLMPELFYRGLKILTRGKLGDLSGGDLHLLNVFGFLPLRAALLVTLKVPKPIRVTLLPFFKALIIVSKMVLTLLPLLSLYPLPWPIP